MASSRSGYTLPRQSHVAAQVRKQQTRVWGCSLIVVAIVVGLCGLYYSRRFIAREVSNHWWIAITLATLMIALWWLTAFVVPIFLVTLAKMRVLDNERYTVSLARMCANVKGMEFRDGSIAIWSSGPGNPVPMLREQVELVRGGLSSLLGTEIESRAPLRIYCFDKRDSLESYHRRLSLASGNSGGGYLPAPARMITISIEGILSRLIEPETWARYLSGFYWLEMVEGFLPPFWLREAVAYVLAASREGQELPRLHRRMLGSLRRGTALGASDLFHVKENTLVQPAENWADHDLFRKLSLWTAQSWSIGEYLFGGGSTAERRARTVAFLKDLKSSTPQDEVFEQHFGHGFDRLLEDWRNWVLDHGEGTHGPPPPRIQAALIEELIPTILNSETEIFDRIHAVRAMGLEGYALGADSLIGLLRTESEIPRGELAWALESISGLTKGDDPEAWAAWWKGIPEQVRYQPHAQEGREPIDDTNALPRTHE